MIKSREPVLIHPLLASKQKAALLAAASPSPTNTNTSNNNKAKKTERISLGGPLSGAISDPLSDPLSNLTVYDDPLRSPTTPKPVAEPAATSANEESSTSDDKDSLLASWNIKKTQILKDYALVGNITMKSSAIDDFDGSGVEDGSNTRKVDLYTQRLASLEKKDESTVTLTQKEYEDHIKKLSDDLNRAWAKDERVGSLKIAIQLAKLLADTSVPKFYPCMFVMVTDVLERFGDMVFNRLKVKAEEALTEGLVGGRRGRLPTNFKPADVPMTAKETCRNWFYKTACIRELLPRIYIEITLLKCYKFLTDSDFPSILSRCASIIRGIGDPLVAFYTRAYLLNSGQALAPDVQQHAISMVHDVMLTYRMFSEPYHKTELSRLQVSPKEYSLSLAPAVEWMLKFVGKNASKETFQAVLYQYREHCNDAMTLRCILDAFDANYYSHASLGMAALILSAEPSSANTVDVFASMGRQLLTSPPPENQRLPLLNDIWKVVVKCDDIVSYVRCTFAWLDTVQMHYSERETMILLADLSSRLQQYEEDLPETVLRQVEGIVTSLVTQKESLSHAVLTSDYLLKILDLFKGAKKVAICKEILEAFRKQGNTSDAVLINTLFDIGRVLHDSFDYLAPPAETRALAKLIIEGFINKIDFGRDLEQQLNIYVECRAIFCNLDRVMHQLVLHVSHLAVRALRYVKGKHNKKTSAFVKACLAYCHISIPSIADVSSKLYLLLNCAQVALLNNCLPQTDTFLKAAISLIPELPPTEEIDGKKISTEDKLVSFVNNLLAFLVVVPGHPEHGPFYIVHGLLNALPRYPWLSTATANDPNNPKLLATAAAAKARLYIEILSLLFTYAQVKLSLFWIILCNYHYNIKLCL
jgi:hypothetical protein